MDVTYHPAADAPTVLHRSAAGFLLEGENEVCGECALCLPLPDCACWRARTHPRAPCPSCCALQWFSVPLSWLWKVTNRWDNLAHHFGEDVSRRLQQSGLWGRWHSGAAVCCILVVPLACWLPAVPRLCPSPTLPLLSLRPCCTLTRR